MIAGLVIASVLAGAGLGLGVSQKGGFGGAGTTVTSTVNGGNSSAPYVLTLIITTNNLFNSTVGDQPAYYVLGPNGMESSANITLPAHRLIELAITNYDDGNANLTAAKYANVMGTNDGSEMVFNNTAINSTQGPNGIVLRGAQTVANMPLSEVSHTFTVSSLGLNLPIATQSTVVAFFTTGAAGTFTWLCESTCGSGPDGTAGAMSTAGWMSGVLTVG
jgi:hypothetical protein